LKSTVSQEINMCSRCERDGGRAVCVGSSVA